MHEFAVAFILHIDNPVSILPAPHLFSIDDHAFLAADNSERDKRTNAFVQFAFFFFVILIVERIDTDVIVLHLRPDPFLEQIPFVHRKRIRFSNHGDNIDNIAEFLHHRNVNRTQSMTGGVDEEKTRMDTSVDNVSISHRSEFFTKVCGVLVFDVFDDGIPTVFVVDLVAVTGGVDDVESQFDAVFDDDVGNGMDFGGLADGLVGGETALCVDKVRGEKGVDKSGFTKTSLADDHDVELETTFEKFGLDLLGDRVESNVGLKWSVVLLDGRLRSQLGVLRGDGCHDELRWFRYTKGFGRGLVCKTVGERSRV